MNRTEVLKELDKAWDEISTIISDCHEHGGLNNNFLEPKFKEWFAEKLDSLEKSDREIIKNSK